MGRRLTPARLLPALLLALFLSGCTPGAAPAVTGEHPALTIYTSHREEIYGQVIKEFQERTGLWVNVVTGGSNELFDQIAAEAAAPVCDVMFGGGADAHMYYKDYMEPYHSPELTNIDPAYLSEDDTWVPFSALPMVIIYNSNMLPAKDVPDSWRALLTADRQGQLAFANPATSASCFTAMVALLQATDGPWQDNLIRFAQNAAQLSGSGEIPDAVAEGQYVLGITLEEAAYHKGEAFSELKIIYPAEGVCVVPDATSLVKNAPHPQWAQQFIDFTLSCDVQTMVTGEFSRRPVYKGLSLPPGLPALDNFMLPYNYEWGKEHRSELLDIWERES